MPNIVDLSSTINQPDLGLPISSASTPSAAAPAASCGCGGSCGGDCGCGCSNTSPCSQALPPLPPPPSACADGTWTTWPYGSTPTYDFGSVPSPLTRLAAEFARVQAQVYKPLQRLEKLNALIGGYCTRVDTANGSISLQIQPPASDPQSPQVQFSYNSTQLNPSKVYGGWYNAYARSVTLMGGRATILTGTGTSWPYHNVDPITGYFQPIGPAVNSLRQLSSGFSEVQANGLQFRYDSSGALQSLQPRGGGRYTIGYNGSGPFTSITDPFQRLTTLVYDLVSGSIQRVQDPGGRITTLVVASGNLTQIIQPDLATTTLIYNLDGTLNSAINPGGQETRTIYLVPSAPSFVPFVILSPTGLVAADISSSSTPPYNRTATDPRGGVTTLLLTSSNTVQAVESPNGSRTSYSWDGNNRLTGVQDGLGNGTTVVYTRLADRTVRVNVLQNAAGGRWTLVYDATTSNVNAVIDPAWAASTTLVRDANGNRIATIDPKLNRLTVVYDTQGQATVIIDPLGNRTTSTSLSPSTVVSVDALGNVTTCTSDSNGQPLQVQNALGLIATTVHDTDGHLTAKVDALGRRTSFSYDANGRKIAVMNPLGAITTTVLNPDGNCVATINPLGNRTTQVLDASGNVVAVVNALGNATTNVFDSVNQLTVQVNSLGNATTFAYDLAGNQISVTNPLGLIATSTYNTLNLPVARSTRWATGRRRPTTWRTTRCR